MTLAELEHPVVASARRLASQVELASSQPGLHERAVAMMRDDLLRVLTDLSDTVEDLRAAVLEVHVVAEPGRQVVMRDQIAQLLTLHVALWQALQYASDSDGATRPVRDALIDVMERIGTVLELTVFKLDVPLATELQKRLAELPEALEATEHWQEILARL
jgi:hypothetical protein